jgi:hypothetical protein
MAWVPPTRLAVASRTGLDLIDLETDESVFSSPFDTTVNPVDAAILEQGPLTTLAVSLFNPQTVDDIDPVNIHDLETGALLDSFDTGVSTRGVTRNPRDPSLLLRLRSDLFAAAELDPVSGAVFDTPPYVRARTDSVLRSIAASHGRPPRIAWTGIRLSDDRDGVFYFNDPDTGGDDNIALGPVRCGDGIDRTYLRAIPDPTQNTRFFAIAEEGGERAVLRFASTGGPCDVVLDGAILGGDGRISNLAAVELE